MNGHFQIVHLLLERPEIDLDQVDCNGVTILMLAAALGFTRIIEVILTRSHNVNAVDLEGRSALMHGCLNGRIGAVQTLLASEKCSVNLQDNYGKSALFLSFDPEVRSVVFLHIASKLDHLKIIELRASLKRFELALKMIECPLLNDFELLKSLAFLTDLNFQDRNKRTILHWAAIYGRTEMVAFLFATFPRRIDFNARDKWSMTPLILASVSGQLDIVVALLKQPGIDVNVVDSDGHTALMIASRYGYPEVVEALRCFPGIDLEIKNRNGQTAQSMLLRDGDLRWGL